MDTTFLIIAVVACMSLLLFLRNKKEDERPLTKKSIEEKYGLLHCDGRSCSLNDECSVPERLFCRDVLKRALPSVKLSAQYVVCLPSGNRKIDFAFMTSDHRKIAIELDGYTHHVKGLTREKFDLQLKRQNELILDGWQVLRFSFDQLTKGAPYCVDCIIKLLGASDPAQAYPFKAIFKDIFYPYEEGQPAINLLQVSGALYSPRRKRWYFPTNFEPKELLPSHWNLTQWTDCTACGGRSIGKIGKYGSFWKCDDCAKTFNMWN